MKKIIRVKTKLVLECEEDFDISDVIENIDYDFISNTDNVKVVNTEIYDYTEDSHDFK